MTYRGQTNSGLSYDLVTPEDDLPGLGQFRLRTSRNWLGPGKSSSVISPFSVSHLPEFLGWEESSGIFLNRVRRSSGRVQRSSCRVQRSSGRVQRGSGRVQGSSGRAQRRSGRVQRSSGRVQRSSGRVQRTLAQVVVRWPAVRQARARISAQHLRVIV
jgi:hypothetical protein